MDIPTKILMMPVVMIVAKIADPDAAAEVVTNPLV
jgi:hypothetical protein